MSAQQPGRGSDQFNLRMPDGMRDRLKAAAESSNRSMNAEIVARLERTFERGEASLEEAETLRFAVGRLHDMLEEERQFRRAIDLHLEETVFKDFKSEPEDRKAAVSQLVRLIAGINRRAETLRREDPEGAN